MAKKTPKLLFNKNNTTDKNYKEFEKYLIKLDKEFGNILLQNIDNSLEDLRDSTKDAVNKYINKMTSNESTIH